MLIALFFSFRKQENGKLISLTGTIYLFFVNFQGEKKKKEGVFSRFFDCFPEKKKKAAQSGVFEAPERAA